MFQPTMYTTTNGSETFTAIVAGPEMGPAQVAGPEMGPGMGPVTVFRPQPGRAMPRMILTTRQS